MMKNETRNQTAADHFGWPWIALCLALALHVFDEALHDFLSVYNPVVEAIRHTIPFLPLPTFVFRTWLGGLLAAILLLLALSPYAFRNSQKLVLPAKIIGVLMTGNALVHIIGSVYLGRWMPGVYSSPILLFASLYLLYRLAKVQ
jgi:hypothetical protein